MNSSTGARPATAMRLFGLAAVILGGLVAAVTGPLDLAKGSWLAAYLVLVVGVAQSAMASARRHWQRASLPSWHGWAQLACWNAGSLAVIAGTLLAAPAAVYGGSAALVIALGLAVDASRHAVVSDRERGVLLGYRLLLLLLAVSIPVGTVLST
ncbi:MAG: hypothetical protein WA971_04835, partial [Microbacterium sp.]